MYIISPLRIMGSFSKGFGHQLGKMAANAVGNKIADATGLDQSTHVTHRRQSSAREQYLQQKADQEERRLNFAQHDAILKNADMVREIVFSDDQCELENQVANLHIQMKSEKWHNALGDDKRMNIFTDTLFAKFNQGVKKLEKMDPLNSSVIEYKFYSYFCSWIKLVQKWIILLCCGCVLIGALCVGAFEHYQDLDTQGKAIFWLCVALYVLLRIYMNWWRQIHILINGRKNPNVVANTASPAQAMPEPETTANINSQNTTTVEAAPQKVESAPAMNPLCYTGHKALLEKYSSASPILERGFRVCMNRVQKDILIVGFNPSFVEDDNTTFEYPLPEPTGNYWRAVNSMIHSDSLSLRHRATYLDLFSFRETNQAVGEKEIVYNTQLFGYVVEQVSLIQNVIEEVIKPKLIIVKNKGAWVYFGLNPQFVWMGYQYQFVEEIACGKVYKITGFQASSDRINNNRPTSNIVGSYVIFTEHTNVANYPKPEDLQKYL